jgi:predicted nuclease of predicted toxin-antitoxin system
MKLLFDANLSPTLVGSLADLFPNSEHIFRCGNVKEDDKAIWHLARSNGYVIVTKDNDFLELSLRHGSPPKLILLRTGNVPTSVVVRLLRQHHERIQQFLSNDTEATLHLAQ